MSNPCLVTSSHIEYIYDGEECFCQCKKLAPKRTSWTEANPGRRFYRCADFKVGGCKFFKWYDPPICDRGKELIKAFQNSEKNPAKENENLRMQLLASMGSNIDNEVESSVQNGEETRSNVVEDENEIRDKYMNLKMEVQGLRRSNLKLKLKAGAEKKAKQVYQLLLLSTWLGFFCVLIGMYVVFSGVRVLALP